MIHLYGKAILKFLLKSLHDNGFSFIMLLTLQLQDMTPTDTAQFQSLVFRKSMELLIVRDSSEMSYMDVWKLLSLEFNQA